jgi:hypothetical protein
LIIGILAMNNLPKKSSEPQDPASQENLELRYREVQGLRKLVSQLETSLDAVAPRAVIQDPIAAFTAATPKKIRVTASREFLSGYKPRVRMRTLH